MTTDERLEKLERELSRARTRFRWLVVGAGLCVMSVAVIYAFGQYQTTITPHATKAGTGNEIHATNIVLEDANGKPRASLGMTEDGPALRLSNENGKTRTALYIHGSQVGLEFYDESGKLRSLLGVAQNVPMLYLYDANEEPRASLVVLPDGPHLLLLDEKGKPLPIK